MMMMNIGGATVMADGTTWFYYLLLLSWELLRSTMHGICLSRPKDKDALVSHNEFQHPHTILSELVWVFTEWVRNFPVM